MSELIEDTPKTRLRSLVQQILERETALPDFQRDFVWDPAATQELIVSIAKSYPAGSLLAIRNTGNYFACREFEGAPPLDKHKPTYLILDGQQRLTSLYQAFQGAGEYVYYFDIKKYLSGVELEDDIFYIRKTKRNAHQIDQFAALEWQAKELVLPLSTIYGSKDGYLGWSDEVAETFEDGQLRREIKVKLRTVKKEVVQNIEDYTFPLVLLSDKTPADAVCTIFETLNRTGVKLSVFDLLVARFWPEKVMLREMWQKALAEHPIIEEYQIDPYYVLQSIALLREDAAPSCKRTDVLKLAPAQVRDKWDSIISGLSYGLEMLRDDCGVISSKWLPYNTMVVPLASIIAKTSTGNTLKRGDIRRKVVRWFWCSVFGQKYESAPNFQSSKDLVEVTKWIFEDKTPQDIAAFTFQSRALYEVTAKQRALYRGVIALILSQHPRDFHKSNPITNAIIRAEEIDDHHIFPDGYLKEHGVDDSKARDCILNRTLIDARTNRSLKARAPGEYFIEIRAAMGEARFDDLMVSHILPPGGDSSLATSDYAAFLEWRSERMGVLIQSLISP